MRTKEKKIYLQIFIREKYLTKKKRKYCCIKTYLLIKEKLSKRSWNIKNKIG